MKMPRTTFARSLSSGLLGVLSRTCLVAAPIVLASTAMVACADENDPKTWVKRLDDPAQRAPAIKRLDEMFNAAMGSESNNREAPKVKAVVDDSIEALAKTYTAGGLDEKTRKDLIKLIADMGDPRAAPAFAKAFKDYEPGKNDDDVKFAAQGSSRLSNSGKLTDQPLIDALWDCFAKFQPSKAKSINLVKDLQSAVKTVKHPSWGPKAVALLNAPVTDPKNPDQGMDQLQFWQLTAVQLIGDTKFTAGVGPLVKVLMTPTKRDLTFPVRLALHKMPKEAEPELIKALKGEGDYQKLAEAYPEKAYLPLIAEPLAYISRPSGLTAIQEALTTADTDQNRTILATYLTYFPTDPKNVKAYTDAYAKIAPNAAIPLMGGANGHAILAGTAANFFDPSLTEWILKEVASAKGEAADAMPASGLPAAIKLMTVEQAKAVGDAVNKIPGQAIEKDMFKSASAVLDKCKKDAACYLGVLDTPVPSAPPAAKMGHVKAVWMAVELHPDDTRTKLLERVEKVKDGSVRLAILEGIDTLSPKGDAAIADKLEKLVETERAAGNAAGTDEMYRIALKLRSRVP
ncbi:MAG: hypothetical protein KF764_16700 [Labilithrix sp.]|nr:hypothetical protein [Labilithrix sp.]MBX3220928.1 hypothetical protein [Labilithrix sp.]